MKENAKCLTHVTILHYLYIFYSEPRFCLRTRTRLPWWLSFSPHYSSWHLFSLWSTCVPDGFVLDISPVKFTQPPPASPFHTLSLFPPPSHCPTLSHRSLPPQICEARRKTKASLMEKASGRTGGEEGVGGGSSSVELSLYLVSLKASLSGASVLSLLCSHSLAG